MAVEKRPKYCPARASGGEVEAERTKARPKPGLVEISRRMEKMNWVEKEVEMADELGLLLGFLKGMSEG